MNGGNGAFGQSAVADFATARSAHEADFAHAERREVVVQHEALERFAGFEQFDALLVVFRAKRDGDQRLRFAAGEERGAMGARQDARFAPDVADFVECAAVGTATRIQHFVAENIFLQGVEDFSGFGLLLLGASSTAGRAERRCVRSFRVCRISSCSRASVRSREPFSRCGVEFLVHFRRDENLLRLARGRDQLLQNFADFLAAFMAVFESAKNFFFRGLLRAGFHHHNALLGGGDDDVQLRSAAFRIGGIGDVFAIDHAHANCADQVMKRNIGNGERGAGADDAQHARDRFRDRPKAPWR